MTNLEGYLRRLSERRFGAAWADGIEYRAFAAVVGDREHAMPGLTPGELFDLSCFMRQGGWVRYDQGVHKVDVVEWMAHYVRWARIGRGTQRNTTSEPASSKPRGADDGDGGRG